MSALDGMAVEVTGLEKSYVTPAGRQRVLDGVDLTVGPGEIVVVAGRSGSGKTTLLTILAGWDEPDAGTVTVLGARAGVARARPWRDVAVVPQSLGLLDELTVHDNVALPARLDRTPGAADPTAVLRQLGIDHLAERYPNEVSLGERQRAACARAIVAGPRLVLADEPIAHQSTEWAEATMSALHELAAAGTACILVSHNPTAFEGAHHILDLGGR